MRVGISRGVCRPCMALNLHKLQTLNTKPSTQASLEASVDYAQQREAFGSPIAKLQAIQFKIADMAARIEAARLLM